MFALLEVGAHKMGSVKVHLTPTNKWLPAVEGGCPELLCEFRWLLHGKVKTSGFSLVQ